MKKVNTLRVKVEYWVELSDFEVDEYLFEEMSSLEGRTLRYDVETEDVLDFLNQEISEKDAYDWRYEIDEIE